MEISSRTFYEGEMIPERCAYGRIGAGGKTVGSDNRNPHLAWSDVPEGTKSLVLCCIDDDVPTNLEERDATGELPASQPRRRFIHWVQANVSPEVTEVAEGALEHGKKTPAALGRAGVNDYSRGEKVKPGEVGTGYDGPCPPFFDARRHYYRFQVIALDIPQIPDLPKAFTWNDVDQAMKGHVLGTAELVGRYTLNPRLRGA
ncbi:YbhB/YbcL family Raf kinase inhibitor-like protein [Sutterella sp.]|uniref:YbhB/YbcL family Raf kinase inhibitor-like protein n=1 Tax=Sutterella sp. TaxID=1981025 RepID=UPI0026DECE43|nr:YbhB/YbcL family Raf kinase inhibitor-like protein [Sutterella sp.]MDO5531874.1 YbhB/YbcL family Raf kinase inhibitor-like protein [Sutterella sp.]